MIPISKNQLQPIITSNIEYVNSLEEFEKIELQPNETVLRFDNNQPCFYVKECNKAGEILPIKIYFYEDFSQRVQKLEKDDFIYKCQKVGLDAFKTEIACMFFLDKKKPYDVWIWALEQGKTIEWDYVRNLKYRIKKKLFEKVI